jgi:hypothetical protein
LHGDRRPLLGGAQQGLQRRQVRAHRAGKADRRLVEQQQAGEGLDVDIADQRRLVLDVDPARPPGRLDAGEPPARSLDCPPVTA